MDQSDSIIRTLRPYTGVIFDFDGTLGTLAVDWPKLKILLARYCLDHLHRVVVFTPLTHVLNQIKDEFGTRVFMDLVKIIASMEVLSPFYPNRVLVDYVNGTSQKVAIYSMNTRASIRPIVGQYFIRPLDPIVGIDNCLSLKPGCPDIMKIMSSWRVRSEEVIFVGNSQLDVQSAALAGISSLLLHHEQES